MCLIFLICLIQNFKVTIFWLRWILTLDRTQHQIFSAVFHDRWKFLANKPIWLFYGLSFQLKITTKTEKSQKKRNILPSVLILNKFICLKKTYFRHTKSSKKTSLSSVLILKNTFTQLRIFSTLLGKLKHILLARWKNSMNHCIVFKKFHI